METNSSNLILTGLIALVVGFGVGVPVGMSMCEGDGGAIVLPCDGVDPGADNGQFVSTAAYSASKFEYSKNQKEIYNELVSCGSDLRIDTTMGGRFNRCVLDSLLRSIPVDYLWLDYRFGLEDVDGELQTCLYLEGGDNDDGEALILGTGSASFCPTVCESPHDGEESGRGTGTGDDSDAPGDFGS